MTRTPPRDRQVRRARLSTDRFETGVRCALPLDAARQKGRISVTNVRIGTIRTDSPIGSGRERQENATLRSRRFEGVMAEGGRLREIGRRLGRHPASPRLVPSRGGCDGDTTRASERLEFGMSPCRASRTTRAYTGRHDSSCDRSRSHHVPMRDAELPCRLRAGGRDVEREPLTRSVAPARPEPRRVRWRFHASFGGSRVWRVTKPRVGDDAGLHRSTRFVLRPIPVAPRSDARRGAPLPTLRTAARPGRATPPGATQTIEK